MLGDDCSENASEDDFLLLPKENAGDFDRESMTTDVDELERVGFDCGFGEDFFSSSAGRAGEMGLGLLVTTLLALALTRVKLSSLLDAGLRVWSLRPAAAVSCVSRLLILVGLIRTGRERACPALSASTSTFVSNEGFPVSGLCCKLRSMSGFVGL